MATWNLRLGFILLLGLGSSYLRAQQYTISTVAGGGPLPASPAASSVALGYPYAIAADSRGNVYIAIAYAVLKMDPTGALSAVAGAGTPGDSGDGGPATNAQIGVPMA